MNAKMMSPASRLFVQQNLNSPCPEVNSEVEWQQRGWVRVRGWNRSSHLHSPPAPVPERLLKIFSSTALVQLLLISQAGEPLLTSELSFFHFFIVIIIIVMIVIM